MLQSSALTCRPQLQHRQALLIRVLCLGCLPEYALREHQLPPGECLTDVGSLRAQSQAGLTLAASSRSGVAIWRSILRWAGARGAPNPGVEYAHDAPFSFAKNRNTCSGLI